MMTLAQASAYFDRTEVRHPDTGAVLFLGQVDPYDDSKRDAGAAYRRVLSVASGTVIPASREVRIHGQEWVLGTSERDGLSEIHREKYVLQPARAWNVSRLPSFLSGAVTAVLRGAAEWIKDTKEAETSSQVASQFNGLFSISADIRLHDVLWVGAEAYLSRAVRPLPSGFTGVVLARLDYPLQACTVTERVYDPVAGAYAAGAPQVVQGLRLRWQDFFAYESQAAEKHRPGDDVLLVPASAVVSTSSTVQAYGSTWSVYSVESVSGVKALHVRAA
jgi:hypothetical protein